MGARVSFRGRMFFLFVFVAFIFLDGSCFAKNLYVSPTGNDSVSYADNSISNPWLTPNRAIDGNACAYDSTQLPQAGDTVYFRAGTYTVSTTIYNGYCGNDGTSSAPITYTNYTGETPVISFDANQITDEHSYHVYNGLIFTAQGTSIQIGYNLTPTNVTVQNCNFTMTQGDPTGQSNVGSIVADNTDSNYCSFLNNTFTGPLSSSVFSGCSGSGTETLTTGTASAIMTGKTLGTVAKNNNISCYVNGIFYKWTTTDGQGQSGIEFGYNYIINSISGITSVANYANIHDNLLIGNGNGIWMGEDGGGATGCNNDILNHNTIVVGAGTPINIIDQYGAVGPCYYTTITNNIFTAENMYDWYDTDMVGLASDYNLYPTETVVGANRTSYTLSAWKSFSGLDAHSLSATPTFTGGSTPSTIAGYALTSGSVGHAAASDGLDMGANISLVGASASGSTSVLVDGLVADAGPDQTVAEGTKVTLNSSNSTAVGGPGIASYLWTQMWDEGKALTSFCRRNYF